MGVLDRGERGDDNGTSLKEGGGIEMSIYSAFHIRDARSLRLKYSPCVLLPALVVIAEIIAGPGRAHTFNVMLETHHALSVWGKTFKTLAWLLPYK